MQLVNRKITIIIAMLIMVVGTVLAITAQDMVVITAVVMAIEGTVPVMVGVMVTEVVTTDIAKPTSNTYLALTSQRLKQDLYNPKQNK
jgi:hypothetical protein